MAPVSARAAGSIGQTASGVASGVGSIAQSGLSSTGIIIVICIVVAATIIALVIAYAKHKHEREPQKLDDGWEDSRYEPGASVDYYHHLTAAQKARQTMKKQIMGESSSASISPRTSLRSSLSGHSLDTGHRESSMMMEASHSRNSSQNHGHGPSQERSSLLGRFGDGHGGEQHVPDTAGHGILQVPAPTVPPKSPRQASHASGELQVTAAPRSPGHSRHSTLDDGGC